jgi:SWI/SNF-related matrix-associated actin-dependent regulator of chromatin subfamily D
MSAFLMNIEKHRDIDLYDDLITSSIRKINEHRRRRAFFLGFSHSPVDFINGLIASQSRDLKSAVGNASRNAEKERRSDFYNQPWYVYHFLIATINGSPRSISNFGNTLKNCSNVLADGPMQFCFMGNFVTF